MRSIVSTDKIFITGLLIIISLTALGAMVANKCVENNRSNIEQPSDAPLKKYVVEYISNGIVYVRWHTTSFDYAGSNMLQFVDIETGKRVLISTSNAIVTISN